MPRIQCFARSQKGEQCKNHALDDSLFCYRHYSPRIVKEVDFQSAASFWNALSPHGRYFRPRILYPEFTADMWAFRGTGDSRHVLIPSALRPSNRKKVYSLVEMNDIDDVEFLQLLAEHGILSRFYRLVDQYGLTIPEDSRHVRSLYQFGFSALTRGMPEKILSGKYWLPDELQGLAALAQHYGLPTRLLDWTRDPYTAAYFAVSDARQFKEMPHKLVVWALNTRETAENLHFLWDLAFLHRDYPLRIITAPSAIIPNLRAQQGLFTLWLKQLDDIDSIIIEKPDRRPLDKLICDARNQAARAIRQDPKRLDRAMSAPDLLARSYRWPRRNPIYKFTLSTSQADELLRILIHHGYTAARMFPGYGGVAEAVREMTVLDSFNSS